MVMRLVLPVSMVESWCLSYLPTESILMQDLMQLRILTISVRCEKFLHSIKCYSIFPVATFDVQDPHVESLGGGKIKVTGNFINESHAVGCFLAIQCNITTEIRFIALKRNGTEQHVSDTISLPSSNYTVYAHDLEEGAVINPHPANLDPDNVTMITVTGKPREYSYFSHCIF